MSIPQTTNNIRGRVAVSALAIAGVLAGCTTVSAPAPVSTPAPVVSGSVAGDVRHDRYAQYGYVSDINVVASERRASGAGALIGGALGAVLGNQIGGGSGRTAATVAGAVGGAVAGHQIEQSRSAPAGAYYDVRVRMDNGDSRVITVADLGGLRVGERVRVEGENIIRL